MTDPISPERWVAVRDFAGFYEVSNLERVRSVERTVNDRRGIPRHYSSRLLAAAMSANGRLTVTLNRDGAQRTEPVHRLVANHFVQGKAPKLEVCHRDGDPMNNLATNLRWDSHSANQRDAVRHGTHSETRKTHCPHGHPYSASNTRIDSQGARRCRTCRANQRRANV